MKTVERRSFLKAAGGLAVSTSISRAAGETIRAAMLRTEHSHARGKLRAMLDSPEYEVAGVCEPDQATRSQRQDEDLYRGLRWFSEGELLGDSSIQLVVVECPVWEAVSWGRKVIEAGKHLHLEKPPSNELAPFRELVEEARRKNLLLQVGYVWRFHQGIGAAIEAARKGWLGDVFMLRGTINTDLGLEAREPLGRYRGGMMFELGCHLLDRVVDLFGRPREVRSWLRHGAAIDDKLADNTLAVLEYDRALALISSAAKMSGSAQHRSFELLGTEGSIMVQPIEPAPKLRVGMRKAQGPYKEGWQEVSLPPQPRYTEDFREMARALKTKQPLKHSYDHELLVQETLLRASGEMA